MTPIPRQVAAALLLLASLALDAQQPPLPRTVILLDPAHGGPDPGAHLPDHLEKEITLAFAQRLRAQLATSGFTIIATRDADPSVLFPTDQRAEIANHAHPAACLILHATSSGHGIHLVTSALVPSDDFGDRALSHGPTLWDTAQTAFLPQSLRLANELGAALLQAKLPVLLTRATVRPLDNLTCPAVALEIAPSSAGSEAAAVTDPAYQQRIARAIAAALTSWRLTNLPPAGLPPAGATPAGAPR